LPLFAQPQPIGGGLEPLPTPVIAVNPELVMSAADREDPVKIKAAWAAAFKRPVDAIARNRRKADRQSACAISLSFGTPARSADGRYAYAHPTFGVIVADHEIASELVCAPAFRDSPHDRKWLEAYFAAEIERGAVQMLDALPEDWKPLSSEP